MLRLGAVLSVLVLIGCGQGQTQSSQKVAEAICLQDPSTYLDCMVSYTDNFRQRYVISYAEYQQKSAEYQQQKAAYWEGVAARREERQAKSDALQIQMNTHIINGQTINCTTYPNGNMNCY